MHVGPTFTIKEITKILVGEGKKENSDEFRKALRERFVSAETMNEKGEALYIEI